MRASALRAAVFLAAALAAVPHCAHARDGGIARGCWTRPAPETFEEVGIVSSNAQLRAARQQETSRRLVPAVLMLSDGDMKIAYGAGLVIGWGDTGTRPELDAVLAVGKGALIAPFAFIGADGDALIADLFNCRQAKSWPALAEIVASLLDRRTLDAIAQRHAAGARLMVALPGSPVRPESVWDLGMIAASSSATAAGQLSAILRAAVDPTERIEPGQFEIPAGRTIPRNWTFRKLGAGEPFLAAPAAGEQRLPRAYFAIHNGVLFPDESDEFVAAETNVRKASLQSAQSRLVHALDIMLLAGSANAVFQFSSARPGPNLAPVETYDPQYMRDLFHFAYRQGRMLKAWRNSLPTERQAQR